MAEMVGTQVGPEVQKLSAVRRKVVARVIRRLKSQGESPRFLTDELMSVLWARCVDGLLVSAYLDSRISIRAGDFNRIN